MDFKPGDRVLHPLFGSGMVRMVSGSGPDARITVDFAPEIGSKKLVAHLANLKLRGVPAVTVPDAPHTATWYERLCASAAVPPNFRTPTAELEAALFAAASNPIFWTRLRERLRARGAVGRVVDEPSGQVFIDRVQLEHGRFTIQLTVRHSLRAEAQASVLARELLEELRTTQDSGLERVGKFSSTTEVLPEAHCDDARAIHITEEDLGNLPDRAPLRRLKPVLPKGVIRAAPKRRDDY